MPSTLGAVMTGGQVLSGWLFGLERKASASACGPGHPVLYVVSKAALVCRLSQPEYLSHCCDAHLSGVCPPVSLQGRCGPQGH